MHCSTLQATPSASPAMRRTAASSIALCRPRATAPCHTPRRAASLHRAPQPTPTAAPTRTLRFCEHGSHTTLPHWRQWCLRFVKENVERHNKHAVVASSSTHTPASDVFLLPNPKPTSRSIAAARLRASGGERRASGGKGSPRTQQGQRSAAQITQQRARPSK